MVAAAALASTRDGVTHFVGRGQKGIGKPALAHPCLSVEHDRRTGGPRQRTFECFELDRPPDQWPLAQRGYCPRS